MKFKALLAGALFAVLSPALAGINNPGSGAGSSQPAFGQNVINFNFATNDVYNNLFKGLSFNPGNNSPTLFFTNGYPSGVLTAGMLANPNPVTGGGIGSLGYYGHYVMQWTGATQLIFQFNSMIVYSGGAGVPGVSPAASGALNGLDIRFSNNPSQFSGVPASGMNVEFSFGNLINSVGSNGGLVEFTTPTNGMSTFGAGTFTTQINNAGGCLPATGPNADGSWTATKTSAQTFTIAASGAYVGCTTVTGTGGPGIQSEFIFIPGSGNISFEVGSPALTHTVSNIIFAKKGNLAAALAGQLATQSIVDAVGSAGLFAGYVRYMDSMATQAVYANFSDSIPTAQMTYSPGLHWRSGKWGGVGTCTGDEQDVANPSDSPPSGPYVDGEVVQFTTGCTNTTNKPTIKLGTRAAVPIIGTSPQYQQLPLIYFIKSNATALANASVTGNGTTMTVTTSANHGLTNGAVYGIKIAGTATPSFDGTLACTITGVATFTCPSAVNGTAVTPGTYQVQTAPGDIINLTFGASYLPGSTYTFKYYVSTTQAAVTATIGAGTNILNVTAVSSGIVQPGQTPNGLSNSLGVIQPYGTGGTSGVGGTGTYALSLGQTSLTNITTTQGINGSDIAYSTLINNIANSLSRDPVTQAYGITCGSGNNEVHCWYWPSQGALTTSVSVTGNGAEGISVGTLPTGFITNASNRTMQYSGVQGAFLDLGATGIFQGIPLDLIKEISNRAHVGAWLNPPLSYTQSSWQSLGSWAATNMPGIPVIVEPSNEVWNGAAAPYNRAITLGNQLGLGGNLGSITFRAPYSYLALLTAENTPAFKTGYTSAGGSSSLVHPTLQNWALDALTNNPSNSAMVPFRWNGALLTPTQSFTGAFGTTNGVNTVTVSGLTSGAVYSGLQLTGSCVSGTARIVNNQGTPFGNDGNTTYTIDSAQSGTCTVTATNPNYAVATGPGGTSNATSYNAFPTRPIDLVDNAGYAIYYTGALLQQGAGQSFGSSTQSFYNTIWQASEDYV